MILYLVDTIRRRVEAGVSAFTNRHSSNIHISEGAMVMTRLSCSLGYLLMFRILV
jgi:hypothetical protein